MNTMTPRERFRSVFSFKRPDDRLPMIEWAAWWDQTILRWKGEGLPAGLDRDRILRYFGLDVLVTLGGTAHAPGLLNGVQHGHPVIRSEADYEALLPSLYPAASIEQAVARAADLRDRHERGELVTRVWLDGFFWWPRILLGIENHLMAFYDQPELMHRINRDLLDFNRRMLDGLCGVVTPDMVGIAEDMSYNHGPMLSRDCFNEFLLPYYRQIVPEVTRRGIKVLVDTDGMVEPMIPWLLDAGFDGVYPLERQAGVDVVHIRQAYPRLLMLGGYDKMVLSKGEAAMRAEFERLLPVMRSGGYVPSVDHLTPPDVSLEQYRTYVRLFGEYAKEAVSEVPSDAMSPTHT